MPRNDPPARTESPPVRPGLGSAVSSHGGIGSGPGAGDALAERVFHASATGRPDSGSRRGGRYPVDLPFRQDFLTFSDDALRPPAASFQINAGRPDSLRGAENGHRPFRTEQNVMIIASAVIIGLKRRRAVSVGLNPEPGALQGSARRCYGQAPQSSIAAVPLRALRSQHVAVTVALSPAPLNRLGHGLDSHHSTGRADWLALREATSRDHRSRQPSHPGMVSVISLYDRPPLCTGRT